MAVLAMIATATCLNGARPAFAQGKLVPSAIPGVSYYAVPPANFSPLTATDAELRAYGYPPRPAAQIGQGQPLAQWQATYQSAKRTLYPLLAVEPTVVHRPHATKLSVGRQNQIVPDNSPNWSGYALDSSPAPFTHITGQWIVPWVYQPASNGGCRTWIAAEWVGIDGYGAPQVIQAGTSANFICNMGQVHSLWIEWYPAPAIVTNLTISAGEYVQADVWYDPANPKSANMQLINISTSQRTALNVQAPNNFTARGQTAEWIMERPGSSADGTLYDLPSYTRAPFFNGRVRRSDNLYSYPRDPQNAQGYELTIFGTQTGSPGPEALSIPFGQTLTDFYTSAAGAAGSP